MLNDILAFVPLLVLMVLALATRKMAQSMIAAVVVAMAILYKQNILTGMINEIYGQLSNDSLQFVFIILFGFGAMTKLFQDSGALLGFGDLLSKVANGKKKPLILGWLISLTMFIDDYLCVMTTTFALKEITDRNRIPREHLAFQSNAVAACLCVILPFSSWTAFSIGLLGDYGLGFNDYVRAIPYMFYPFIMIIIVPLIAVGVIPKLGVLKKAWRRVDEGGDTYVAEEAEESLVSIEMDPDQQSSSAVNAIIPIAAMVAGVLIFDNDLAHGIFIGLAAQFILYVAKRIMTVDEFFKSFFEGAKSMTTLAIIVTFGFTLTEANKQLGFFDILLGGVGQAVPAALLPALAFILVGFTTFATSGCWVMQIISYPIFIPLALNGGLPVEYVIAAIMSSVTMGYCCCFYGDAVFMTSAGSGVSNLTIVKSTVPYAAIAAAVAVAGFLIIGFVG